jgi:hypothetical protein
MEPLLWDSFAFDYTGETHCGRSSSKKIPPSARRGRNMLPRERIWAMVLTLFASAAMGGSSLAQEKPDSAPPGQSQQPPAQQPPANSSSSQQAQQPDKGKDNQEKGSKSQSSGTSNDRLFFTLPNFLTLENANQVPPLTAGQKFKVVARSSFDYVQYPWYGFLAGISQAENSEPGYGQGAAGYGKRFGAATADGTIENFMTSAVFPSLLRQDPRFFQSGKGGFWHRTGYALSRVIITRGDSGHSQANFSEIIGSALSAGISTYSYHPHADRTLRNSASVWGSQIGYDTLTYVVKEFWPDIRRKIHKN